MPKSNFLYKGMIFIWFLWIWSMNPYLMMIIMKSWCLWFWKMNLHVWRYKAWILNDIYHDFDIWVVNPHWKLCFFWESVCYKHVDVEYLRYFEWFDLLVLMELFWTRVWKKSTTWLILIDGKHDGSRCIFIYYWNCFVVDCLWNDLS